jgi:hypothetical protein
VRLGTVGSWPSVSRVRPTIAKVRPGCGRLGLAGRAAGRGQGAAGWEWLTMAMLGRPAGRGGSGVVLMPVRLLFSLFFPSTTRIRMCI